MTIARTGFRFMAVGFFCAVLHNIVMLTLDRLGVHYVFSSAISYVLVVLAGYALHVRITFRERASLVSLFRYALTMAVNYPANVALLFLMCDVAGLPIVVAVPAATIVMLCWNFIAGRWAIVQRKARPADAAKVI